MNDAVRNHYRSEADRGIAGVGNVGMDSNWTGNKAGAGQSLRLRQTLGITVYHRRYGGMVRQSFCLTAEEEERVTALLCTSREVYEDYTCPLAVGFMCRPKIHYGVDVDGYEYDRWGT